MLTDVVFINPSTIRLDLGSERLPALPGTEKACLLLAHHLNRRFSVRVHYVGNVSSSKWRGVHLYAINEVDSVLKQTFNSPVVWVRSYGWGADLRARYDRPHLLWSGDAFEDLVALGSRRDIIGCVDQPDILFARYREAVLVSDWQCSQWQKRLDVPLPLTRIYNLTEDSGCTSRHSSMHASIHTIVSTSHPRKSLGLFCQVARAISSLSDAYRFISTSSPRLYGGDDNEMVYIPTAQGSFAIIGSFCEVRERYSDVVEFRDLVDSAGISSLLESADIFLHPDSSVETGSMALIEAMKHGVVPVVSKVGALPELCGSQGLVVPGLPGERRFLRDTIGLVLGADSFNMNLTEVQARFGVDTIVDQWRTVLGRVSDKEI